MIITKCRFIIPAMSIENELNEIQENGGYLHAEIEGESPFKLGHRMNLTIKPDGIAEKMPAEKEKKIDLVVHTNGSVVLVEDEDWHQKLDAENEEGVVFPLWAAGIGEGHVTVSAFYQRHWLTDINFDLEVK